LEDDEKFNGENWAAFKLTMLTKGNTCGLVNYWENKVTIPGTTIAAQPNTPVNSTTPSQLEYIQRESMLKAMVYEEGEKVSGDAGYIEKMRKVRKEANDAGANINNDQFKTTLLDSFLESWDSIISTLYAKKSLTVITTRLIAHSKQIVGWKAASGNTSTQGDSVQALQASVQALTLQVQNLMAKKNTGPNCSDKSHPANDNCKGIGYTLEECWKLGGGCQGQYPPWWKGKRDAPLLNRSANLATTNQLDPGSITMNIIALNTFIDKETLGMAYQVIAGENTALVINNHSPGLDTSRMYGDSGVSTHFVQNRDHFFNYIPLETSGSSLKVGATLKVLGNGTVTVKTTIEGTEKIITFSKTLHCPDISANLLSISQLDKEGWKVTFGEGKADFMDPNGKAQFTASMFNDLYMIDCTLIRGEEYSTIMIPLLLLYTTNHYACFLQSLQLMDLISGLSILLAWISMPNHKEKTTLRCQKAMKTLLLVTTQRDPNIFYR
ncbi:hypothetical protein EDD85DRAFT_759783, partial [Armillaria nabsnona]